jgi:hypothetical protein
MTVNFYDPSGGSAGLQVGAEVSSTYEGRHLTFEESLLVHPSHTDGFVDKGDPVVIGRVVGIALKSAAAATDMITIDTEGLWKLNVYGAVSDGTADGVASALAVGTPIYINKTTAVLSGISDPGTWVPFGIAMSVVASGASTLTLTTVKVHQNYDNMQLFAYPDGGSMSALTAGSVAGAWAHKIEILIDGVIHYIPVYNAT